MSHPERGEEFLEAARRWGWRDPRDVAATLADFPHVAGEALRLARENGWQARGTAILLTDYADVAERAIEAARAHGEAPTDVAWLMRHHPGKARERYGAP